MEKNWGDTPSATLKNAIKMKDDYLYRFSAERHIT